MDTNGKKLINNLEEDYCSFEVSKLLKWKDFGVPCLKAFNEVTQEELTDSDKPENMNEFRKFISRPTHSLAISWIRENFRIHIGITKATNSGWYWRAQLLDNLGKVGAVHSHSNFANSPQEATESALKYTLENLIK